MVKMNSLRKCFFGAAVAFALLSIFAPVAFAADEVEAGATGGSSLGDGIRVAGLGIGAGLALLGGAMGTGRAQASIGAGGTGAMAEKPELFTSVLILVALPETIVVFGFVIAFLILGNI